jgi:threonyl-tRNA synthetase
MGGKIAAAREQHIPWMLIMGDRDMQNGTVSVRLRTDEDLGAMPTGDYVALAQRVIDGKAMELK